MGVSYMDKDLQVMKGWFLDRVGKFMSDIEFSQDSLDVESKLYTIASTTNHAYQAFHKKNCAKGVQCDHSFMKEPAVQS